MKAITASSNTFERYIIIFVTTVMGCSLFLQVVSRYVFNFSITWAEEVSIFGMVWLAYFGSALAVTQRKHIRILLLPQMFSERVQKIVDIFSNIVFFVICVLLVYGTYNLTALAYDTGQVAAATRLPRWIIFAGMPIAFSLNAVRLVQDTMRCLKEYKQIVSKQEDGESE